MWLHCCSFLGCDRSREYLYLEPEIRSRAIPFFVVGPSRSGSIETQSFSLIDFHLPAISKTVPHLNHSRLHKASCRSHPALYELFPVWQCDLFGDRSCTCSPSMQPRGKSPPSRSGPCSTRTPKTKKTVLQACGNKRYKIS